MKIINLHTEYNTVDMLKLIMSVFVVSLHTFTFRSVNIVLNNVSTQIFTRIAVPVFFMITGVFLYGKSEKDILKFIRKILGLYIIWSLVYLPWFILDEIGVQGSFNVVVILKKYILFFLTGNSYQHLWYLFAAACGSALLLILNRYKSRWMFCLRMFIGIVFFMVGLLSNSYFGIGKIIWAENEIGYLLFDNFYFARIIVFSYPYLLLGNLMCECKVRFEKHIIPLTLFVITYSAEVVILSLYDIPKDYCVCVMQVPCVFMIVHFAFSKTLSYKWNYHLIRKLSTWIYLTHLMGRNILRQIFGNNMNSLILSGGVLGMCVLSFFVKEHIVAKLPGDGNCIELWRMTWMKR